MVCMSQVLVDVPDEQNEKAFPNNRRSYFHFAVMIGNLPGMFAVCVHCRVAQVGV